MKLNRGTILMTDSCSGGLSVLKYIKRWSNDYKIIYVADYEKNPFGLKNHVEIVNIVKSWFTNLVKKDKVKIVVIACNTASIAIKYKKAELSKKFGIPVITMIDGIKKCIKIMKSTLEIKMWLLWLLNTP